MMKTVAALLAVSIQVVASAAEPANDRFLAPLGVDLRSLQLDAVPSHFGSAATTSKAGYQSQKCYLWPDVQVTYSGHKGFWMGFEMTKRPVNAELECVEVRPDAASIVRDVGGLHLGMTGEEFASTIGATPERKEGWLVVRYEWSKAVEARPPGSGVATVTSTVRIEGEFVGNRLTTLRIIYGASV